MNDYQTDITPNENHKKPEQYFGKAVQEVIATVTGIQLTEKFLSGENREISGEISGAMLLVGKKNILFHLTMSYQAAAALISNMAGTAVPDLKKEELYDGVAELVNMIAGQTKSLLAGTPDHFQLTAPFTVIGSDHRFIPKNRVIINTKEFQAKGVQLFLQLIYM